MRALDTALHLLPCSPQIRTLPGLDEKKKHVSILLFFSGNTAIPTSHPCSVETTEGNKDLGNFQAAHEEHLSDKATKGHGERGNIVDICTRFTSGMLEARRTASAADCKYSDAMSLGMQEAIPQQHHSEQHEHASGSQVLNSNMRIPTNARHFLLRVISLP